MAHPGVDLVRTLLGDRATAIVPVEERRANLEALAGSVPAPPGVEVTELTVGGRPAERSVPVVVDGPGTVLYLHGGGYVSGSLGTHRGLAGRLALAAKRPVVSLDYRLAPEHPFPAGLDDAVAAVRDLQADGPVAVAGDSAGGGLTMATLLRLRDEGGEQPVAGLCISPWVDLTQSGGSHVSRAEADPMLSAEALADMAQHYLQGEDASHPLASPMHADLEGLPPLRIDVGDAEVLLDDSVLLAERVQAATGDAELVVWPELFHVFPGFPAEIIPESDECLAAEGEFLARHLDGAGA
ncbi:MAG: alpha/beta hydrolase [Acidimicrobiales bacterium]|nr:alpha/beta hydrolase [Actinomycetota bacterium]